jgi:hypothetical protein
MCRYKCRTSPAKNDSFLPRKLVGSSPWTRTLESGTRVSKGLETPKTLGVDRDVRTQKFELMGPVSIPKSSLEIFEVVCIAGRQWTTNFKEESGTFWENLMLDS